MKMPLDPLQQDLAAAEGIDSRKKREEVTRRARAKKGCATTHTFDECSGTETLAMIERALLRLASGTYGTCVSCGADISLKRLEQNPAVETCDACCSKPKFKAH